MPETNAFKSYAAKHERKSQLLINRLTRGQLSPFDTVSQCQQHSALPKTMATDAASPCWSEDCRHHAYSYDARAWPIPRTRIGSMHTPRVCTFHYNPRRACAARVIVVVLCVCLSVKSHLTSRMSNRAINEHTYLVAYECKKICGDLPETTAFKSYVEKHERKSQHAKFTGLPDVSFLHSTRSETSKVVQGLSTTCSLAQNNAYWCC